MEDEKDSAEGSVDLAGRQIINDGTEFPSYNEADKPSDDKIYSTYTATIGLKREYSNESVNMTPKGAIFSLKKLMKCLSAPKITSRQSGSGL